MISEAVITESLGRLSLLKRFPTNIHALKELARILGDICRDDAGARKLVGWMTEHYDEWPGPQCLRANWENVRPPRYSSEGNDPFAIWVPSWKTKPKDEGNEASKESQPE